MNNDSWFQSLIKYFNLASEKINYRLIACFFGALLLTLPAIYALVLAWSSPANLIDYLATVAPETPLNISEAVLQTTFDSTFSFLSNYLIWVVIGLFLFNFGYQLFVIYIVAKLVIWIAKSNKLIYNKVQVYNTLLLVYSVKTVLDVIVIYLVNDNTGNLVIALVINGVIYYCLYRILSLLPRIASEEKA
jgi:hypothetical protein